LRVNNIGRFKKGMWSFLKPASPFWNKGYVGVSGKKTVRTMGAL